MSINNIFVQNIFQLRDLLKCVAMVQSFKEEQKICKLILQKWDVVQEIVSTLKIVYKATVVMQKEDFKLSDFYASLIYIEVKLEKCLRKPNKTRLGQNLQNMLEVRKPQLMKPPMISALALDPRFCAGLDESQKEVALDTLDNIWKRMQMLANGEQTASTTDKEESESSSDEDITINTTTLLNRYWKKSNQDSQNSRGTTDLTDIRETISLFMIEEHVIPDGSILDFWNSNKIKYPDLYQLAEIIFAISPTQSMVERSFSTLSHIFNVRRNRLSEQMLEDILIISLNEDIFYAINEEEINSMQ